MRPIPGTITDPAIDHLVANVESRHKARAVAQRDLAHSLARVLHQDQKYGGDEPYIRHVSRVAARVALRGDRAVTIAYLHDVIEDTPLGAEIVPLLFDKGITWAVQLLTRVAGQTYTSYIASIADFGDEDTLAVKIADIKENLSRCPASGCLLRNRYEPALEQLQDELERRDQLKNVA